MSLSVYSTPVEVGNFIGSLGANYSRLQKEIINNAVSGDILLTMDDEELQAALKDLDSQLTKIQLKVLCTNLIKQVRKMSGESSLNSTRKPSQEFTGSNIMAGANFTDNDLKNALKESVRLVDGQKPFSIYNIQADNLTADSSLSMSMYNSNSRNKGKSPDGVEKQDREKRGPQYMATVPEEDLHISENSKNEAQLLAQLSAPLLGRQQAAKTSQNASPASSTRGSGTGRSDFKGPAGAVTATSFYYDVIFTDEVLGFQVRRGPDKCSYVDSTKPAAAAKDVRVGDRIVAVGGEEVRSHDEFITNLRAGARPVRITFYRDDKTAKRSSIFAAGSFFGLMSGGGGRGAARGSPRDRDKSRSNSGPTDEESPFGSGAASKSGSTAQSGANGREVSMSLSTAEIYRDVPQFSTESLSDKQAMMIGLGSSNFQRSSPSQSTSRTHSRPEGDVLPLHSLAVNGRTASNSSISGTPTPRSRNQSQTGGSGLSGVQGDGSSKGMHPAVAGAAASIAVNRPLAGAGSKWQPGVAVERLNSGSSDGNGVWPGGNLSPSKSARGDDGPVVVVEEDDLDTAEFWDSPLIKINDQRPQAQAPVQTRDQLLPGDYPSIYTLAAQKDGNGDAGLSRSKTRSTIADAMSDASSAAKSPAAVPPAAAPAPVSRSQNRVELSPAPVLAEESPRSASPRVRELTGAAFGAMPVMGAPMPQRRPLAGGAGLEVRDEAKSKRAADEEQDKRDEPRERSRSRSKSRGDWSDNDPAPTSPRKVYGGVQVMGVAPPAGACLSIAYGSTSGSSAEPGAGPKKWGAVATSSTSAAQSSRSESGAGPKKWGAVATSSTSAAESSRSESGAGPKKWGAVATSSTSAAESSRSESGAGPKKWGADKGGGGADRDYARNRSNSGVNGDDTPGYGTATKKPVGVPAGALRLPLPGLPAVINEQQAKSRAVEPAVQPEKSLRYHSDLECDPDTGGDIRGYRDRGKSNSVADRDGPRSRTNSKGADGGSNRGEGGNRGDGGSGRSRHNSSAGAGAPSARQNGQQLGANNNNTAERMDRRPSPAHTPTPAPAPSPFPAPSRWGGGNGTSGTTPAYSGSSKEPAGVPPGAMRLPQPTPAQSTQQPPRPEQQAKPSPKDKTQSSSIHVPRTIDSSVKAAPIPRYHMSEADGIYQSAEDEDGENGFSFEDDISSIGMSDTVPDYYTNGPATAAASVAIKHGAPAGKASALPRTTNNGAAYIPGGGKTGVRVIPATPTKSSGANYNNSNNNCNSNSNSNSSTKNGRWKWLV